MTSPLSFSFNSSALSRSSAEERNTPSASTTSSLNSDGWRQVERCGSGESQIDIEIIQQARVHLNAGRYQQSARLLQPLLDEKIELSLKHKLFWMQSVNYQALQQIDKAINMIGKAVDFLNENRAKDRFDPATVQELCAKQMELYSSVGQESKVLEAFDSCLKLVEKPNFMMLLLKCTTLSQSQSPDDRALLETATQALRALPSGHSEMRDNLYDFQLRAYCGLNEYDAAIKLLVERYRRSCEQVAHYTLQQVVRSKESQADDLMGFILNTAYLSSDGTPPARRPQVIELIKQLLSHKLTGLNISDEMRAMTHMRLARFLVEEKQLEQAESALKVARSAMANPRSKLYPEEREQIVLVEAMIANGKGEYERACSIIEGIDVQGSHIFTQCEIARIQFTAGRYGDALKTTTSAIEASKKWSGLERVAMTHVLKEISLIQSKSQRKLGLLEERAAVLKRDLSYFPPQLWVARSGNYEGDRAQLLLLVEQAKNQRESKRYKEAIETTDRLLLSEDLMLSEEGRIIRAKLLYTKAWSQAGLKQYKEAIATVDSMENLEGVYSQLKALLYFAKAWAQIRLKQFDEALATLDQALDLEGVEPKTRGQLEGEKRKAEEARSRVQVEQKGR